MWRKGWREQIWSNLNQPWDLVIVGGGITGAGVLRQAVNTGLKALLVERHDFASGTSSRSSKLIHGGLRYILNKQYRVTQESVREREWILKEAPHLVEKLSFLFPNFERYHVSSSKIGAVIAIYDLLAPKWDHRGYSREKLLAACPFLNKEALISGYEYYDAVMDDCRVLMRVIREAVKAGGTALNYAAAEKLLRNNSGQVCGVVLKDMSSADGRTAEVQSRVVVNAAGPWSDDLRGQLGQPARLRKLRGSHLIFPFEKLPVKQAITLIHPRDSRATFVIPWEGATIVGTTDIDHNTALDRTHAEPFASRDEIDYIMEGTRFLFPEHELSEKDITSSFAGLRPIIRGGADSPSQESRAHALWEEDGLITITGGKYTTFRIMSRQTVNAALANLGKAALKQRRIFNPLPAMSSNDVDRTTLNYLAGRHGFETADLISAAAKGELEHIDKLPNVWAELRWAAREEGVLHLDDLLMRRVRIGMLLPRGAGDLLERIRGIVQPELGWTDDIWQREAAAYLATWQKYYSPIPG